VGLITTRPPFAAGPAEGAGGFSLPPPSPVSLLRSDIFLKRLNDKNIYNVSTK